MKWIRLFFITSVVSLMNTSAFANQWVTGTIAQLEEYGGFSNANGSYGIVVFLNNKTWLSGDTSNGPTNCPSLFRIVVGFQNIDENSKTRMFSILLASYTSHNTVSLFVDTSTSSNFCYVQMVAEGSSP
jgi:hypothetical protein